jgi:hypothetical protein
VPIVASAGAVEARTPEGPAAASSIGAASIGTAGTAAAGANAASTVAAGTGAAIVLVDDGATHRVRVVLG